MTTQHFPGWLCVTALHTRADHETLRSNDVIPAIPLCFNYPSYFYRLLFPKTRCVRHHKGSTSGYYNHICMTIYMWKKKTIGLFWTYLKHLYVSRGNKGCHTMEGWAPADTSEIFSAGTFILSLGSVHCGRLLPPDQALGLQVLFVLVAIPEANS